MFHRIFHRLLLDTGAESSLFSSNFVKQHNLPVIKTRENFLILADQSKVSFNQNIDPINLNFGHLMVKLGGLVCPNLNMDVIGGMDWLRRIKPTIN